MSLPTQSSNVDVHVEIRVYRGASAAENTPSKTVPPPSTFLWTTPTGTMTLDVDRSNTLLESLFMLLFPWSGETESHNLQFEGPSGTIRLRRDLLMSCLNGIIGLLEKAIEVYGSEFHDTEWYQTAESNLEVTLLLHYQVFHTLEVLDKIIEIGRRRVQTPHSDNRMYGAFRNPESQPNNSNSSHPTSYFALNNLATWLDVRLKTQPQLSTIDELIQLSRKMEEHTSLGDPSYIQTLTSLVTVLSKKAIYLSSFAQSMDAAEMDELITLHQRVIHLIPWDVDVRSMGYFNLGRTLKVRYDDRSDAEDFRMAMVMSWQAFSLRPPGHPSRADSLESLGQISAMLSLQNNDINAANQAIGFLRGARELRSPGHPNYRGLLSNLATALRFRAILGRNREDAEEAMALYRLIIQTPPSNDILHMQARDNLAEMKMESFQIQFMRQDSKDIVVEIRRTLESCPVEDRETRITLQVLLAKALTSRFFYDEGYDLDLSEAVALLREARALSSTYNLRAFVLTRLAESLQIHANIMNNIDSLNASISIWREVLEGPANRYYHRWDNYNSFAIALRDRYTYSHPLDAGADLEEAITFNEMCLRLCPHGEVAARPWYLNQYAISLFERATHKDLGRPSDLDNAISSFEESISLLTPTQSVQVMVLSNAAMAFYHRFKRFGNALDLKRTVDYVIRAVGHKQSSAHRCLWAGILWIRRFTRDSQLMEGDHQRVLKEHLLDIYGITLSLLPKVAFLGSDLKSRVGPLKNAPGMACDAMAHAISVGDIRKAVVFLEQGRAVLWSQALRLRLPLDALPPELAEQLVKTSKELEKRSHNFRSIPRNPQTILSEEQEGLRQRELAKNYEVLFDSACEVPGFRAALRPQSYSELSVVASQGPVVIFNSSRLHCDAVIIRSPSAEPEVVPLGSEVNIRSLARAMQAFHQAVKNARDGVKSNSDTQERAGKGSIPSRGGDGSAVLSWLWDRVVHPVIAQLKLSHPKDQPRPRLWICPSGLFVHLPLHAAGRYYGNPEKIDYLSNYVLPSYTPTLETLIRARKSPSPKGDFMVLPIGQPHARGMQMLPSVKDEIRLLGEVIPSHRLVYLGADKLDDEGTSTTFENVMEKIPQASVLHFACHGIQDQTDALQSGFAMLDKRITVADLMKVDTRNAQLAYLGACQTFTFDATLPDECINLASAMLFVGFRSVAATMWSMGDADGPQVAKEVYNAILSDEAKVLNLDKVPEALDYAVRQLRNSGSKIVKWAPYVHVGV